MDGWLSHRHFAANDSTARHKNDYSMIHHDSKGHEEACKKAAPDDICTNCGVYELGLVRDICQQCKTKLFGRELEQSEERSMAEASLARFNAENPRPLVDESVPRFGPYDPYLHHDYERTWTTRLNVWSTNHYLRIQTRARFPWMRVTIR